MKIKKERAYSVVLYALLLMKMKILFTDLDNTMIYSYRHDIGSHKRCAEIYQGREISFVTDQTYELLRRARKRLLIVPVTTRTIEQYRRIDLGTGEFEYALTCNGGVLLRNGQMDEAWYQDALAMIKYSADEVKRGIALLQKDDNICFEIRYIMDLFVFTKSLFPKATAAMLRSELDGSKVDVFDNGAKVYIVPKMLDKGGAVMRLAHQLGCETLIAAGDSEFDIPMLRSADVAIYPRSLNIGSFSGREMVCPNDQILSEWMLNAVLEQEEDLICS